MTAKSEPVSTELTRSIRQDLERFHRGAQLTFDREDILDVLDMYERSLANRADLAAENERLRAALREALEKATGCAPADRLHELEPLWAVLDRDTEC
ncbi:MAG TPA: hypothetical protein VFB50_17780 [Chloroflexota bacterium]|nr:hypothetical protein [Chloroflexota bacterium]